MNSLRQRISILAAAIAIIAPAAARAQIAVLSSTVEEKIAAPGEKYTGTIVVSNPSSTPQVARIYQTDYRFAADGTAHYDEPGTTTRSNASWITPQASRIVVPPNSQVSVPYSVAIPVGDYAPRHVLEPHHGRGHARRAHDERQRREARGRNRRGDALRSAARDAHPQLGNAYSAVLGARTAAKAAQRLGGTRQ